MAPWSERSAERSRQRPVVCSCDQGRRQSEEEQRRLSVSCHWGVDELAKSIGNTMMTPLDSQVQCNVPRSVHSPARSPKRYTSSSTHRPGRSKTRRFHILGHIFCDHNNFDSLVGEFVSCREADHWNQYGSCRSDTTNNGQSMQLQSRTRLCAETLTSSTEHHHLDLFPFHLSDHIPVLYTLDAIYAIHTIHRRRRLRL